MMKFGHFFHVANERSDDGHSGTNQPVIQIVRGKTGDKTMSQTQHLEISRIGNIVATKYAFAHTGIVLPHIQMKLPVESKRLRRSKSAAGIDLAHPVQFRDLHSFKASTGLRNCRQRALKSRRYGGIHAIHEVLVSHDKRSAGEQLSL